MAGFLYFFPNARKIATFEDLPKECKLGNILNDVSWDYNTCTMHLPEEQIEGVIIAPHSNQGQTASPCIINRKEQTWIDIENYELNTTTHWIGYWNARPPTPDDLIRKNTLRAYSVDLNGKIWGITGVNITQKTEKGESVHHLPKGFSPGRRGLMEYVVPGYEDLTELSVMMWDRFILKKKTVLEMQDVYDYCVQLLNLNYHVGEWECSVHLLNIIKDSPDNKSTGTYEKIILASLGIPAFEAETEAKKKMMVSQPLDT